MSMNISLSNRRSLDTRNADGATSAAPAAGPTAGTSASSSRPEQPSVTVDQGPSQQSRRLAQAAGPTRQCSTTPAPSMRADEATIETYRRALAQGRTPAAPPAPPALPSANNAQVFNALVRSLPSSHPLRAALSQVSWQDSNRPPISDFMHHVLMPRLTQLLPEGAARAVAEHVLNFLYPDFTQGTAGHHGAEHFAHATLEEAVTHAVEHFAHHAATSRGLVGHEAASLVGNRVLIAQVVSNLTLALHVIDSTIMTGRELARLARGEVIPTQAIVDAQRTQEASRARTQFDEGVRAAVHGTVDCSRMASDRVYAQGVEAGAQFRRQHGEAFAAQARHNEAMIVARQRNLASVAADVRPLTAGPERNPGDAQSDAINRALLAQ